MALLPQLHSPLALFTYSVRGLVTLFIFLSASQAMAEWYTYRFTNGEVVVIGAGDPQRSSPNDTNMSLFTTIKDERRNQPIRGTEANDTLGLPRLFSLTTHPVDGIILFGGPASRKQLQQGSNVRIPIIRSTQNLNDSVHWQSREAIAFYSLVGPSLVLTVVTSDGLHFQSSFNMELGVRDLQKSTAQAHQPFVTDLYLTLPFEVGQRAFIGLSLNTQIDKWTVLISRKMRDFDKVWDNERNSAVFNVHSFADGFFPNLFINRRSNTSSTSRKIDLALVSQNPDRMLTEWESVSTNSSVEEAKPKKPQLPRDSAYGASQQYAKPQPRNTDPSQPAAQEPVSKKTEPQHTSVIPDGFKLERTSLSSGSSHWTLRRIVDGKSVDLYIGPALAEPSLLSLHNNIVQLNGARRKVSIDRFDFEATYKLSEGKEKVPTAKDLPFSEGPADIQDLVDNFLERWNSTTDEFYFNPAEREKIEEMRSVLVKTGSKSIVVLGDSGSGSTALLHEALKAIPSTWDIYSMSASSLVGGTSYRGQLEARIEALKNLARAKPIVLLVEKLSGFYREGSSDGIDPILILGSAINDGKLILVATDTKQAFHTTYGSYPEFKKGLRQFETQPISNADIQLKLRTQVQNLGLPRIKDDVLKGLIELSSKALPQFVEPYRSNEVLRQLAADLPKNERGEFEITEISIDDVKKSLARLTRLKMSLPEVQTYLTGARKKYRSRIVGKDPAYEMLFSQAENAWMGFYSGKGPMIRLLMPGPAGAGKSQRGKAFADAMDLPYLSVSPTMFGTHPSTIINNIAEAIQSDPFTVLMLDELDKFPEEARHTLLELLANDYITISVNIKGKQVVRTVYTRFVSVLVGTNAGEETLKQMMKPGIGFTAFTDSRGSNEPQMSPYEYKDFLRQYLGVYLVDRFPGENSIARIPEPDEGTLRKILLLRVSEKLRESKTSGLISVSVKTDHVKSLVDHVVARSTKEGFGVRDAEGLINQLVNDYWKSQIRNPEKEIRPAWAPMICRDLFK